MKKTALVLPVFAALALTSGNNAADAFDVTVSALVSPTCAVTGIVSALEISGGITELSGKLDISKALGPTTVANISCNGKARIELAADKGFFKSTTDTASCPGGGSVTCLQYDAKLSLGTGTGAPSTPIVNSMGKTQNFTTAGVASGPVRLEMKLSGPTDQPLVAGTYSEKFAVTITPTT